MSATVIQRTLWISCAFPNLSKQRVASTCYFLWQQSISFLPYKIQHVLIFIGPCIIVIVENKKTNLMSLVVLFHFLCAQHVSELIYPSSGACDCAVELPHWSCVLASACNTDTTPTQPHQNTSTHRTKNTRPMW